MDKREAVIQFHRERIIEAAESLFLDNGVETTTMDMIAKKANYSKTTLYKYFESKQEIYYTVTYRSFVMQKKILEEVIEEEQNFFDQYFSLCQEMVNFQKKYPLYFDTLLETIDINSELPILNAIYDIGEEINGILQQLLEKGVADGMISSEIKFPEVIYLMWSSISGIIRMADKKEAYFTQTSDMSLTAFRNYGFKILLQGLM
ncbi:TetR/AcrR family transcriptional regulator [Enterococcus sp. BWR-S5]|uniref:TetR/AcrR family transcriptional regulator n=1 Tax=Enterococcus sp. BWR-S5 TaxID=2787714 RepID=UPI001921694E|nr:TetR/AcrR family transcriptional regulator [Enterococcus sp. BWR-S5]MBL1224531.1 TetR/AcrR family transcriptional regulator [Enterococcus sp. BWR-S5]